MRIAKIPVWAAAVWLSAAFAQTIERKEPAVYTGTERASRVEARAPGLRLGLRKPREFALSPLSGPESLRLAQPDTRMKAGLHRALPAGAMQLGNWETTAEGRRVWRLALRSPESSGIRVEFSNFDAGGGKVWLHDGAQSAGPYTSRGLFGDGRFWSATIFSDSVTLEYEPAEGADTTGAPPFELRAISHQAGSSLRGAGVYAAGKDPADVCHLDPSCFADWKPAMSMVAQIAYEENGLRYTCSGSLLATRDNSFIPYLLTAGHCIHSEATARTVEVFWTYQTSSCGATPPPDRSGSTKSTQGAHLIDWGTIEEGDFSLLLLRDVPSGVTFGGWDASDPQITSNLVGVHHPAGSWKRISFGERVSDYGASIAGSTAPADRYLQVVWDRGRTEPGSSGSPVFSSPGVIVGMLSYGPVSPVATACEISPSVVGYGRFSNAYPRLRDYLENLPVSVVSPDRASLSFTVANRSASPAQTVRLTTQAKGQVGYKVRADAPWIQVSAANGSSAAGVPGQLNITVDGSAFDRPGAYTGTVTILSGAAAPQFINVAASVVVTQSNVQAEIAPRVVTESDGVWSFRIRLAESAGASTRVTGIKVNGSDYSDNIVAWFGADRIEAKGSIEAPLQASGRFPAGVQYFEFRGVDDFSGQTWYRVAAVTFQ